MTTGVNATTAKTWLENEVNSYLATVPQETKSLLADVAIVDGNIVMPSTQYQAYKDFGLG